MRVSLVNFVVGLCVVIFLLAGCSQNSHHHSINPAYRPDSEYAAEFVKSFKTSTIAVYPTIIRTIEQTTYSEESQRQLVSLLGEEKMTSAKIKAANINPGPLKGPPQWNIFVHDLNSIAERVKEDQVDAHYSLVMEIIFPPDNRSVWGIHCFIFDHQGNNVFSFLLNSHHKLFSEASLSAEGTTEAIRNRLIEEATRVGIKALMLQVEKPLQEDAQHRQGYTISSQKIADFGTKVDNLFVIARIHERLKHVFMHSLKHSMESAFESNGVTATIKLMPRDSDDYARFDSDVESLSPDAMMFIDLDPLYRKRKDAYQAVVGTVFKVKVINRRTEAMSWQAKAKVDYIKMFGPRYTAHEGIRKEFAWTTTAAIVRTFVVDVNGHKSAPIYTVTEDRQLYRQRTD